MGYKILKNGRAYYIGSRESSAEFFGDRLHKIEHVNSLVRVLQMALFEIFLERERSHTHVGVKGAHFDFSWEFNTMSKWFLALDWEASTAWRAYVKETHLILVHHAASSSQHAHHLKVGGFLVTETPSERSLESLTEGDAACQDQAIVRPEHRYHL